MDYENPICAIAEQLNMCISEIQGHMRQIGFVASNECEDSAFYDMIFAERKRLLDVHSLLTNTCKELQTTHDALTRSMIQSLDKDGDKDE